MIRDRISLVFGRSCLRGRRHRTAWILGYACPSRAEMACPRRRAATASDGHTRKHRGRSAFRCDRAVRWQGSVEGGEPRTVPRVNLDRQHGSLTTGRCGLTTGPAIWSARTSLEICNCTSNSRLPRRSKAAARIEAIAAFSSMSRYEIQVLDSWGKPDSTRMVRRARSMGSGRRW